MVWVVEMATVVVWAADPVVGWGLAVDWGVLAAESEGALAMVAVRVVVGAVVAVVALLVVVALVALPCSTVGR